MPFFETDQSTVHYLDDFPNNLSVVMLLHGLGTEGSSWRYQIKALGEAGYRPIAIDVPGFGRSNFTGKRWSISFSARVVNELAGSLREEKYHIAGISMGGTIALQTALDFPFRIRSLVLLNTFATLRPKRMNEWVYLLRRYIKARLGGAGSQAEITARRIFPKAGQEDLREELIRHIRQTDPIVYKAAMLALGTYDARRNLKSMQMPVMVLSGDNDTTVPLENQHDLVKGIPNARQEFIANAGHGMIVDQPEIINKHLLEFFESNSI